MIICSCNRITDKDIRQTVINLLAADANCVLTPGVVYREMGLRAQCGTCLSIAIETIIHEIDHPTNNQCQIIQLQEQRQKLLEKNRPSITAKITERKRGSHYI